MGKNCFHGGKMKCRPHSDNVVKKSKQRNKKSYVFNNNEIKKTKITPMPILIKQINV